MLAGIVMAVVSMITNYFTGAGFFLSVKLIAATFMGVDAIIGGVPAIALGLVLHLMTSAVWGIIFSYVASGVKSLGRSLAVGILFSIGVWAIMAYLALPVLNEVMKERVDLIGVQWFINHIVFGLGLGLFVRSYKTNRAYS